jgi:CheY-like chemotaxis protein
VDWGHEVIVATNGGTAVDLARSFRPDVALLDIAMPGMDGCDAATRIRHSPGLGRVLLVATTGYPWGEDIARGRVPVFDHYLLKPFDPALLQRLLDTAPALTER